jgi:hypothetical protein
LPEDVVGAPDLDFPESQLLDISTNAGLSEVTSPNLSVGDMPEFYNITLPEYTFTPVEMFDAPVPDVSELPSVDSLATVDEFVRTISPSLEQAIEEALSGAVLDGPLQQAMFNQLNYELSEEFYNKEHQLFEKAAAQGFSDSTGPLAGEVAELHRVVANKRALLSFQVRDEVYKRSRDKLTKAISQAAAIEALSISAHLDYCAKLVETLTFNVRMHVTLFNVTVDMFNKKLSAIEAYVGAYNEYVLATESKQNTLARVASAQQYVLDTNSAKLSAYEAQVRTEQARGEEFATKVNLLTLPIKEYRTYISGVMQNVDIVRQNLEAYKRAIQAYSQTIEGDKARINGYSAQVRATGSAAGVYEANWRSYAAFWSTEAARADSYRSWNASLLQTLNSEIGVFKSAAQAQRSYIAAVTEWASANDSVNSSYSRALAGAIDYTKEHNRASAAITGVKNAVALITAETSSRQSALQAQADAVQATIDAGLAAATATTMAGFAQAAYSVKSVSASISANAGLSNSVANSSGANFSRNWNRGYSNTKTQSLSN